MIAKSKYVQVKIYGSVNILYSHLDLVSQLNFQQARARLHTALRAPRLL